MMTNEWRMIGEVDGGDGNETSVLRARQLGKGNKQQQKKKKKNVGAMEKLC